MAGYYLRAGDQKRFLIYLEGGGWCYDQDCTKPSVAGTLEDCRKRSYSRLGSSRLWGPTYDRLTGCLSADPSENPVFNNWTLVYVPYCDGTSFSGDAVVDGLHFKGRAILRAIVDDLKARTGIQEALQVVLSGGSAGASAVYYHVDGVSEQLKLDRGEVLGLPDAGFFLDLKDKDGMDCWPSQMRSIFEVSNGFQFLHSGCLERFSQDPSKCLFPEYFGDLISSRVLILNSLYDSSETYYTLRLDCCPGGCGGRYPTCAGRELDLFVAMKQQHHRAWAALANRTGNGVWAPACPTHTMAWDHWADSNWEVPAGSGNTMAAVVHRWLGGSKTGGRSYSYEDVAPWPHNKPCASSSVSTFEQD
jgi:hypothetical protein